MFQDFLADFGKKVQEKIQALYPDAGDISLKAPKDRSHGDYAVTTALKLAKQLGKNPQEIAKEIKGALEGLEELKSVEVAGPGFVNLRLKDELYLKSLEETFRDDLYAKPLGESKDTVLVEYPSTNVAKPLAVHHLLSAVIGQTMYNVAKKLGKKAVSINHIGDYGTQFGKLIFAYKNFDHTIDWGKAHIMDLLDLYVRFGVDAEKHPEYEDGAREEFKKLEQGDKENVDLWKKFVEVSMHDAEATFERLGGITIDETMGESFYSDKMAPLVEEGKKKKIFVESEGAFVCKFPEEKLSTVVIQKSDGATLYITRDIATVKYRLEKWKPKQIIYTVDVAQKLHFEQVFEICKMLGMETDGLRHLIFGRMSFKTGEKMSTRSGDVVLLDLVIDEAIARSEKIILEHQPDIDEEHLFYLANICGTGGLKYNVLKQNPAHNFAFDWDDMLALTGNSAPYLQYTHARAKSILRKAEEDVSGKLSEELSEYEKNIVRRILEFPTVVQEVYSEMKPNLLANYLFEMTQDYNVMYDKHRVLQAENKEKMTLRLMITSLFATTLKEGMKLLGIEVPEEM